MHDGRSIGGGKDGDPRPWSLVIAGVLLSAALFVFSPQGLGPRLTAMMVLWAFAVAACRRDLAHPYVWFGFFYLLYAVSAPALIHFRIHPYMFNDWGGREITTLGFDRALEIAYLGFLVFVLLVGPARVDLAPRALDGTGRALTENANLFLAFAVALVSVSLLDIYLHGFGSKAEITLYGGWVARLSFAYNLVVTGAGVVLYKYFMERRVARAYIVIAAIVAFGLVAIFISGQRNFLFRFLIVAFFMVHLLHRRFSLASTLMLTLSALTVVFVLGELKNIWQPVGAGGGDLQDGLELLNVGLFAKRPDLLFEEPFALYSKLTLFTMLGTEFMTAGNNLAMILDRVPQDLPFMHGSSFLLDISRVVTPGFIVGMDVPNTMQIYHEAIFPGMIALGTGPGFSLLGMGYMNFGTAGSVLVMVIVSLALRRLYRWAGRSTFGFLFFLAFMPIAAYAMRTDMSAPLSQGLKHVLLPLLILILAHYLNPARRLPRRAPAPTAVAAAAP